METVRPDPADYMLQVARLPSAIAYKTHVLAELALAPELKVVDVGCGPGTDLQSMSECVDPGGLVVGLDSDAQMLSAAGRLSPSVAVVAGDAHRLPFPAATVDRLRTDRSLQHMHDVSLVLAEFWRVLKPGGVAVIAEPDWETFVIDAGRDDVAQRFVRYTCNEVVRNATVGRQIARLGAEAGFDAATVMALPAVLRDFDSADKIFGLTRNALSASEAGYFTRGDAECWLAGMTRTPMLAAVILFVTTLIKPR